MRDGWLGRAIHMADPVPIPYPHVCIRVLLHSAKTCSQVQLYFIPKVPQGTKFRILVDVLNLVYFSMGKENP